MLLFDLRHGGWAADQPITRRGHGCKASERSLKRRPVPVAPPSAARLISAPPSSCRFCVSCSRLCSLCGESRSLMTRMVKCALQFPRPFTTVPVWRRHRLQRQQMQSVPKSRPSPCKRKPRLRSVSIYASAQGVRQLRYSIDPGERDYARAAIAPRRLPRPASTGLIFPMDAEETVRREWIGV
jgi:hypothetical protein